MPTPSHPMQPVVLDTTGNPRFLSNGIVQFLKEFARGKGVGMNELTTMPFSVEDREQFLQLIGYSVGGYCELSYVTDESAHIAVDAAKATGFPWQQGVEKVNAWKKKKGFPTD